MAISHGRAITWNPIVIVKGEAIRDEPGRVLGERHSTLRSRCEFAAGNENIEGGAGRGKMLAGGVSLLLGFRETFRGGVRAEQRLKVVDEWKRGPKRPQCL